MKNNKGFSLVELIVVIAIMAILIGVAVPVYSSYVEKSQKAKDVTLVDEVANALLIYSTKDPTASGWVILTPDKAIGDGAFGTEAMANAFGTKWNDSLHLSYDNWTSVHDFLDMDFNEAQTLLGSSYMTGSNTQSLLGEVSYLTDAAFGVVGGLMDDPQAFYSKMKSFFGEDAIKKYFEVTGEAGSEKFTYTDENKAEFQTQISNFLVFAVADTMVAADPSAENANEVVKMITGYSLANAFANSDYAKTNPAIGEAYEQLKTTISTNMSVVAANDALDAFANNPDYELEFAEYMSSDGQATKDFSAFQSMMEAVSNLNKNDKLTAEDLKDSELYSTGAIAKYFDSYTAAAGIVINMDPALVAELKNQLSANPGSIAVYISGGIVGCTCEEVFNN